MASEMLDRIAIAISGAPFPTANSRRKALAAMRAMREPTPVMEQAAEWAAEDGALLDFDRDDFRLTFTAALDAEIAAAEEPSHDR